MSLRSSEIGGASTEGILAPRRAALTAATTAGSGGLWATFSPVCKLAVVADAPAAVAFSSRRIFPLISVSVTMVTMATTAAEAGMSIALRATLQRARRIGFSKNRYEIIDNRNAPNRSRSLTPTASSCPSYSTAMISTGQCQR